MFFILRLDCKKKKERLWHPAQTKTLAKKKATAEDETETDGREGRSGREDGVKAVMTFKMNNALSCITQTRRSD